MNFYTIRYSKFRADLCKMEMECLFGQKMTEKHFFSERVIEPSRSPFIKERISVIYEGDSLDSLVEQVLANHLAAENFKVIYPDYEDASEHYQERLQSERELGTAIDGEADIHHPQVIFGVTHIGQRWYFGMYTRNDYLWHNHDNKPHTYSNSLDFRVARSLVNIGVGADITQTVIDPCCGIGTVVIEALSMGIDARGVEINASVAYGAQKNLSYFGYPDVIISGDMHTIKEHFDVSIVDIPYGLYQPVTAEEQLEIIRTARRISDRMVLVTFDNMDDMIREAGFEVIGKAEVLKGRFARYVNVCE